MKFLIFSILTIIVVVGFGGCETKGLEGSGTGRLNLYLTDSPARYDAVNIVIREVSVHSEAEGWITINDSVRTFDLLSLTNGAWQLLGTAKLKAGRYTQVRLILDAGSTIVVGGVSYPLTVPSGMQTGIKLIHEFTIEEDFSYDLVLDFDAQRSVNKHGNGFYSLKPVIRSRAVAMTGAVSGFVNPPSVHAEVIATSNSDTASVLADTTSGMFKLVALDPGIYSLQLLPADTTYKDSTMSNIAVNAGQTSNIGTIVLPLK